MVVRMVQEKIKIAYLSGPVDARCVYKSWKHDKELQYFGTSYLSQFFEICDGIDAEGFIITNHDGENYQEKLGDFSILNRPTLVHLGGLKFHIGEIYWTFTCLLQILKNQPDLVIVTAAQNYWFCLSPLSWKGTPVLPAVHCTYIRACWTRKAKIYSRTAKTKPANSFTVFLVACRPICRKHC